MKLFPLISLEEMEHLSTEIIQQLIEKDKLFQLIYEEYGSPPKWSRPEGFESLVRIILEQQVSLASAKAAYEKVIDKIGIVSPENILMLSDDDLKHCYFSKQKIKYVKGLASAILNKKINLLKLKSLPIVEIRSQLTSIIGIGKWTTDVYLIFCLQHPDIFPEGDIAAIKSVHELTGIVDKNQLLNYVERWAPIRTSATQMLWHYYLCKRKRKYLF